MGVTTTKNTPDYSDLPSDDTWIAHLRRRLPYSFLAIREEVRNRNRRYILSRPQLTTGWAEYHNYWKRGYVYYAAGRLIDFYGLPMYWREYRIPYTDELRSRHAGQLGSVVRSHRDVFNALQLEKLWQVVVDDHLDRERAVMTNLTQAIEFCLKAVKTHAQYRESGAFTFDDGHDISVIYQSLPTELRLEMQIESVTFVNDYEDYRRAVEARMSKLEKQTLVSDPRARPDVETWRTIANDVDRTHYTAFLGANDAKSASSVDCDADDWLDIALKDIGRITYHRYSPFQGRDPYPTKPIHLGLMLGRFLYEHLFPVPVEVEHRF